MKLTTWMSCALLGFGLMLGGRARAATTWPNLLNYQGQLTDTSGQAVADGTYSIKFSLYTVSSAGSAIWNETQSSVSTSKGLFNVILGSQGGTPALNTLTYTADIWIGITVGSDSEMTPRQQLLSAVYAHNASTLQGLVPGSAANNLVTLDGTGKIPAGLIQGASFTAPVDIASSSASYIESLTNSNPSSSSLGLTITAANGVAVTATDPNGVGVNTFSNSGTAVQASGGSSGAGVSATTLSSSRPAVYAAAANPLRLIASNSASNNFGLQAGTANDDMDANLVDRQRQAAVYAATTGSGSMGVSASAASATGIYGATNSGSMTDYGILGVNTGSGSGIGVNGIGVTGVAGTSSSAVGNGVSGVNSASAAGAGVFGSGFMGVQGIVAQNSGRGVDGEVPASITGAFAVRGNNAATSGGTAIFGLFNGTSASGVGVRGGSTSSVGSLGVYGSVTGAAGTGVGGFANADDGVGVLGTQGSTNLNPSTYSAGVYGRTPTLAQGTGVRGEGSQGVYGNSAGACGVCGNNQNTLVGYGITATSPFQALSAATSSTTLLSYGVNATIQSSAAGSSAGFFQAQNSGNTTITYGINATNANGSGVAVLATGGLYAVKASAVAVGGAAVGNTNSRTNYFSDATNSPSYGFFHQDGNPPATGVGVYAAELCSLCNGAEFSNTSGTAGAGGALLVQGRLNIQGSAGTFLVQSANYSSFTLSNAYIKPDSLVFLTVANSVSSVAAVTGKTYGSATINFTPPLFSDTTYQYLIIGTGF